MEFSELFTQSARDVLPRARAKSLVCYFDHRGPCVHLACANANLRAGIHRILLGIIDCFESGFVMFSATVDAPLFGQSKVAVHAAGTGQPSDDGIDVVLKRLRLHPSDDAPSPGHRPRAEGTCPAMGGRVQFIDAGSNGLVLSLEIVVEATEATRAMQMPDAAGAMAWLISPLVGALDSVEVRLRQLGWHVEAFSTLREACDRWDGAKPMLMVVAEDTHAELQALEDIARAHPTVWAVLAVVSHSPTLRFRGDTAVDIRVLPLSPLELERFTAHVDARISSPEARETSPVPMYVQESRKVLVVDDNIVNQMVARGQLEALGYDVAVASDGIEALDSCCGEPPDMVLMDVDMPMMNGLEASEHLREMQREGTLPPFPIVAATCGDPAVKREECFKAGMDGYLSKPMDLRTLADELHRVLPARPRGIDERP